MKKVSAVLLLVAYLGFITSVFVNTHHDLHVYVCNQSGDSQLMNVAAETSENCCNEGLMSEKLKLHSQHATPFYKVIIPHHFVLTGDSFITTMLQKPVEVYTTYSTPLAHPDLCIKNRVLLI